MDNNNDFFQKFNNSSKYKSNSNIFTTVIISFISAIVGAVCAFFIYSSIISVPNNNSIDTAIDSSNSNSQISNLNLSQVALSNYSDTAIYASNKVLPSMVSIAVQYEVSYMGMKQNVTGGGSGVIISEDGYILTNSHVVSSSDSSAFYQVSDATSINVFIYGDETTYEAKIIGTDSQTDLAVLKIEKTGLVAAELGDSSSIQIGEFVLAVGSPYGLDYSVTSGIISALNRNMTVDKTTYNVIQADCAINSGNSGGALVNSKGQVIGITTLKLSGTGIEGVSFAIPINDTIDIYKELITNGKIARPFVGISGLNLDEATAVRNGLTTGIYIDSIIANSPAEKAGLQSGDVIVKFNDQSVYTMEEFNKLKNSKNIGDNIEITFYRKNDEKTVTITLGEE